MKTCLIKNCTKKYLAKGFCNMHYLRNKQKRNMNANYNEYVRKDPSIRFWKFILPESKNGCWVWGGYSDDKGYGIFREFPKTLEKAHRFSFRITYGPIPDNIQVGHSCNIHACVKPEHLYLCTNSENSCDAAKDNIRKKTHCKQGHEFTEENKKVSATDGRYRCLICMKKRNFIWQQNNRDKIRIYSMRHYNKKRG